MIELKGGARTEDPKLDRVYELDWRSLNYTVTQKLTPEQLRSPRSYTWRCDLWLDQGQEGACVGFGYSHELAARPRPVTGISNMFAREAVYWQTQRDDPWPGGSYPGATPQYEGTSVLTGAKTITDLGFYSEYHWAITVQELVMGIGYLGPAVLGLNWYEGMYDPGPNGFVSVTGKQEGGHCILAKGVHVVYKKLLTTKTWENVDLDRSYLVLHNSWGKDWGNLGTAKLSLTDMTRLLGEEGEACLPTRTVKKAA